MTTSLIVFMKLYVFSMKNVFHGILMQSGTYRIYNSPQNIVYVGSKLSVLIIIGFLFALNGFLLGVHISLIFN